MKELLLILRWSVFLFYFVSFVYYLLYFSNKNSRTAFLIRAWLGISISVHTLYLILLSFRLNHLPVGNLYQVLTTLAWLSVIVYFVLEIRLKEMIMGVFLLPIILILHAISCIFLDIEQPLAEVLTTILFEAHVLILISAYAAFAISFITSIMYILLSREIESKKPGIFFQRLPSLEFFDKLSNQAINIGLILVSLGILLGVYMGIDIWEGEWILDPKLLAVLVSWAIYLAHFVTRKTVGWQGRRAAIVSVIGFNWLLFSFIVVSLFFSKFHNFQ